MKIKERINKILMDNSTEITLYYPYILSFEIPITENIDLSYLWRNLLNNHQSLSGYANRYWWKNKIDGGGIRIISQNENKQYIKSVLLSTIPNLNSSGFMRHLNIRWRKVIRRKLYPSLITGTYKNGSDYTIVTPKSTIEEYLKMIDQNIFTPTGGDYNTRIQLFGRLHELSNCPKNNTI